MNLSLPHVLASVLPFVTAWLAGSAVWAAKHMIGKHDHPLQPRFISTQTRPLHPLTVSKASLLSRKDVHYGQPYAPALRRSYLLPSASTRTSRQPLRTALCLRSCNLRSQHSRPYFCFSALFGLISVGQLVDAAFFPAASTAIGQLGAFL